MAGRNEQELGLLGCTSLKRISAAPLKPTWFYPSVEFWPQISELLGTCNFYLGQIGLKVFSKTSLKSRL